MQRLDTADGLPAADHNLCGVSLHRRGASTRQAIAAMRGRNDATWARGRGHALSQAVIFIPYYLKTNPVGVANAQQLLDAVLTDDAANG